MTEIFDFRKFVLLVFFLFLFLLLNVSHVQAGPVEDCLADIARLESLGIVGQLTPEDCAFPLIPQSREVLSPLQDVQRDYLDSRAQSPSFGV